MPFRRSDPCASGSWNMGLGDGADIAVIGAGPAGSFYALLAMNEAASRGMGVRVTLFDGKPFLAEGPKGCNMCAGVISRRLVSQMAQLGIGIPPDRVQRLIGSYVFHTREGSHSVIAPAGKGPLPVVFRGNGPRFSQERGRISFDDFLLQEATGQGAKIVPHHVTDLRIPASPNERPKIAWPEGSMAPDLVVVASGVSSRFAEQLSAGRRGYRFPSCVRAFQAELDLGEDALEERLGSSIHIFSLGLDDIRFAAIIPKRRFATVSIVGRGDLSMRHLELLLQTPTLRRLLPDGWRLPEHFCSCRPRLPVSGGRGFYGNRLLIVGDASMSRYYKNGIDSAFQTAQHAVRASFGCDLSARALRRSYFLPVRREFGKENVYARLLFRMNDFVASRDFWVRAHMNTVRKNPKGHLAQALHYITWNLFTGQARYRDIFWRSLNPAFFLRMIYIGLTSLLPGRRVRPEISDPTRPVHLSSHPTNSRGDRPNREGEAG